MTDREKKALTEAFGFEEPDRKDDFVQEFMKLDSGKVKKPIFPTALKFAAAAAMMAAVIGTAVTMPKDIKQFGNIDTVTESNGTVTTASDNENSEPVTTAKSIVTSKSTSMTASKTTVTSSKTVTTTASSAKTSEAATAASAVTTASVKLSVTTTSVSDQSKNERVTTSAAPIKNGEDVSSAPASRDMRVSVDKQYPLRDNIISEDKLITPPSSCAGQKPAVDGNSEDGTFQPKDSDNYGINIDISEMYENSCAVILANLDEIVYTSIDGSAFTAENITVSKVYKGDLTENDMLTVFFRGGFLPAEEYAYMYNYPPAEELDGFSVRISGESDGKQEKGRKYIFFLKNSSYPVPGGAFEPTYNGNMSVFEINQGVCTAVGDERCGFTVSRIENDS